jgi:hypothetical protein
MFETSHRRRFIITASALLGAGLCVGWQAQAAWIIPTNANGADAELRESETATDFLGTPLGTNRGNSQELASRIIDTVTVSNTPVPNTITNYFPTGDRSSVMYLKFDISSLPASNDPYWANHKVRLRMTANQNGNFNNLFGPNPSNAAETVYLRYRVLGLEPGNQYADDNPLLANRTDRVGNSYVALHNRYNWSEGNGTAGSGITFYDAPGITPHCMAQGSCTDPNIPNTDANSVVQTLGFHDDFNSDTRVLGTFRPPTPGVGSDLQVGQPIDFLDPVDTLEDLILDAKDAGRSFVTLMVHVDNDGQSHQPAVGRPGITPGGMLNRNYRINPKEVTTLLVDPDSAFSGASNADGRFSPQLLITIPEPGSVILAGLGLLLMAIIRRRG